ncbi:MAG: hypothetical protein AAFQ94_21570 [Bacteroidota bacterium]
MKRLHLKNTAIWCLDIPVISTMIYQLITHFNSNINEYSNSNPIKCNPFIIIIKTPSRNADAVVKIAFFAGKIPYQDS